MSGAKTEQVRAYHISAMCGGQMRKLGTVFIAGSDAPKGIAGQRVLYRNTISRDVDLYMHRDNTNGFSKAAFEHVKDDGVKIILTQSKESGRLIAIPISRYVIIRNDGQGVQQRAHISDAVFDAPWPRLLFPTAVDTVRVSDEDVDDEQTLPAMIQPELPSASPPKGRMEKCGCWYVSGRIEKPCADHEPLWRDVLKKRKEDEDENE